ncbi:lipopolysaccharide transport periplasmic protein LptA [Abyssibacter profundi]|uniref:Lipopolysaccharide transport periplasmic protein LptA n=1 Tax=Abyssibacter profundi TaxID=2182787 RepID=A0A363UM83_9GAMM|nr:lipopolysaccharide transport periplasmic protein LptA [Abyssibacter profundi]MBV61061.1 lipopolysaccharide transport periplasmic protein LptA [Nevskiales bacterium]PWN56535.1 lipopolysaccharide transport periplasmic protein LptA [Abyssibacter profundi]
MNKWIPHMGALLAGLFFATATLAQSGRLTVDADRAELDESKGFSVYSGNVQLRQQNIALTGDRLTVSRPDAQTLTATMVGEPARLTHQPQGSDAPVIATAGTMTYDTRSRVLTLEGSARIERGADTLSADRIEYNLTDQRMRAAGGESERVRITIPAPELPDSP